jgi:hypothetical protein
MMRLFIICIVLAILSACDGKPSPPQGKPEVLPVPKVIVEKERVEKEELLPPEVKIKLKRDGKDNYSWELSGSEVEQILKVNETLRKNLGGEQKK